MPNISAQIIPSTTQELSAILLTLAELGFLGLYVGERATADILRMKTPKYPEWAGMLSGARLAIFKWPWLTIAPAIAITITIIEELEETFEDFMQDFNKISGIV